MRACVPACTSFPLQDEPGSDLFFLGKGYTDRRSGSEDEDADDEDEDEGQKAGSDGEEGEEEVEEIVIRVSLDAQVSVVMS